MKNYSLHFILFFAVAILSASCAPKLVGTWQVSRYESVVPGGQQVALTNIGVMTFKKSGEGEKKLNYTILGKTITDDSRFGWHSTGPYVGIESPGSDFSKTWIIITNKRKEQKWKSTDGGNMAQVLELKK